MTQLELPEQPASVWTSAQPLSDLDPIADLHAYQYDLVVVGAGLVGLTTALLAIDAGLRPLVLERHHVGAGTSGRSTAKVSVLQGDRTARVRSRHGAETAATHAAANEAGLLRVRRLCADLQVPFEARDAWSYATTASGADAVVAERDAATDAGLAVVEATSSELPFPTTAAVRVAEQIQLDPMAYLHALAGAVRMGGGAVVEGAGVTGMEAHEGRMTVRLASGDSVTTEWVVLATLLPFPLRSALFATSSAVRSYLLAAEIDESAGPAMPSGMYLSVDSPTRSLRTADTADGSRLLVGGNSHATGHGHPTSRQVADLAEWAAEHFAVRTVTHRWSAQDYVSPDLLPHVGPLATMPSRVLVASGFSKWGFTAGTAAAEVLAALVANEQAPSWAQTWKPRLVSGPSSALAVARTSLQVGTDLARGWASAALSSPSPVKDGDGTVVREGVRPVATSRVDGVVRRRSAVCPHLGGVVAWNDAEASWDCPLHGSRFGPDGTPLCAPAVSGLANA